MINIVINNLLGDNYTKQTRTHRKKRINKKWRKRYGVTNLTKGNGKYMLVGDTIYCHQDDYYNNLKKIAENKGGLF